MLFIWPTDGEKRCNGPNESGQLSLYHMKYSVIDTKLQMFFSFSVLTPQEWEFLFGVFIPKTHPSFFTSRVLFAINEQRSTN